MPRLIFGGSWLTKLVAADFTASIHVGEMSSASIDKEVSMATMTVARSLHSTGVRKHLPWP